MILSVQPVGKDYGVYVDGQLLGTTKLQCDALFHCYHIQRAVGKGVSIDGFPSPGFSDACENNSGVDTPGNV
jgi:hypothetical protein